MDIKEFVIGDALILIPALYVLGMFLKRTPRIPDWVIPFALLVCGIAGAIGLMGLSVRAVIQGVLVTGAAVLVNQGIKQCCEQLK